MPDTADELPDNVPLGTDIPGEYASIDQTFPWKWCTAVSGINTTDGPYAIGSIVSMKLGAVIVALSHDGPDMEQNIGRCNTAGHYIVDMMNALHRHQTKGSH